MDADFTITAYKQLLTALKKAGFSFQIYYEFINHPKEKVILLRHDVDARKEYTLQFAKIQHEMGILGTYYFRMVSELYNKTVSNLFVGMP